MADMAELDETGLRQLVAVLPFFAVMIDRNRRFVWVNRTDPTLILDEIIGHQMDEFVHPAWVDVVRQTTEEAFRTGQPTYYEARAYGDGELDTWYGTRVVPMSDDRALALSNDVTETYRARRELARSEAQYRSIVQDQTEFVVRYLEDGTRTFVNQAYVDFFGGRPSDHVGQSFIDLVAEEHRPEVERKIRQLVSGEVDVLTDEHLARRADGELRWTEWVDRAIRDSDGGLVELQAVGRDVTRRVRAERERGVLQEELLQAQKMEGIGHLAGGIAHDFNNLLLVMLVHLELADSDDPHPDHLEAVRDAALRARDLTTQLLAFARRAPHIPERVDLVGVVRSSVRMLRRILPDGVQLSVDLATHPVFVDADAAQVTQLLMNTCLNASDAVEGSGEISVAVHEQDGTAVLEVRDDGVGMTREVQDRIFEPFFTTKASAGTGLGMSVVLGIVEQHGGHLVIDSAPGEGTVVHICLPSAAALPPDELDETAALPMGVLRLLLVDDEPAVRRVVKRILESSGHRVTAAVDGEEALELLTTRDFDCIVADVHMPRMGGVELMEQARKRNIRVPFLLVSGNPTPDVLDAAERHEVRLLPKPFDLRSLERAVHAAVQPG